MRRPSPATLIALLALFVALGGPARAAELVSGSRIRPDTITTRQVKARSLSITDLTLASSRALQRTPAASVTAAELAPGAVGPFALAPGSVFADKLAPSAVGGDAVVTDGIGARALADSSVRASEIADGTVGGAEIADGGLAARDVGRFGGALPALDFGTLARGACATRTSPGLVPFAGGQDLTDDALVVTPSVEFPAAGLTVAAQPASPSQVAVTVCDLAGPDPVVLGPQAFRYLAVDAG